MSTLPIRIRLAAWYSGILAISLGAFAMAGYAGMRHSVRVTLDAALQQHIEGVRAILAEDAPQGLPALEDELMEYADGVGSQGRLRVNDVHGKAIFASSDTEMTRIDGRLEAYPGYVRIGRQRFRVDRETLEVGGKSYDVTVAASTQDFDRALNNFRIVLGLSVPILLCAAAAGGYWLSGRALAPVDEMTRAAEAIGAQDLGKRLRVPPTQDELERLASTLNSMLARLEAAFQQVARFTADASHELRTPVAVMRTSAELALRKTRTEDEYREALTQIVQESDKVSRLIEQLLTLARADAEPAMLALRRTELRGALENACTEAAPLAEAKQLSFCKQIAGDQPLWVEGDANSLERLFLILLDNAVKYTPSGGKIEVRLGRENGFAVAEIRDTGMGIAASDTPHIFERFYRADKARSRESGGTGLGLAIGRWIAEAHRGEIRVSSEPAKGSCFVFRIALSQP